MSAANIRIVLVRPQGAGNTGAVARVMKNMGLNDLALVRPRFRSRSSARTMAVHAADVLDKARTYDTLAAAVADCGLVAGTTCRQGPYRNDRLTPRQAAADLRQTSELNKVALVFGPEDHGLSNRDIQLMQMLIAIPSDDAYPSLNLAQAVGVCCYELFVARNDDVRKTPDSSLPTSGDTELMFEHLQRALTTIGFLHRDNPEHIMYALRGMLGRARLDERDVRILLGLARQIEWYGKTRRRSELPTPNFEL
jgi:tRNA/rRNA methyltransferase